MVFRLWDTDQYSLIPRCGAVCWVFLGGEAKPHRSGCAALLPENGLHWSVPWTCFSTDLKQNTRGPCQDWAKQSNVITI